MTYIWLVTSLCLITFSCHGDAVNAKNGLNVAVPSPTPRTTATNALGGKTATQRETNMAEESNTVTMKANAAVSNGRLKVTYELENHSERIVYVWDQMVGYAGNEQIIDEDRAYVFFDEPHTIRLVRANLALPPDIDVSRKEIPFSRAIQPKSRITGKITIPLPAKEYSPFYAEPNDENSRIVKCDLVRIIIGWLEQKDGMKVTERKAGDKTVLAIRGAWSGPYHRLIEQILPVSVDLHVFKTSFDRSLPLH